MTIDRESHNRQNPRNRRQFISGMVCCGFLAAFLPARLVISNDALERPRMVLDPMADAYVPCQLRPITTLD